MKVLSSSTGGAWLAVTKSTDESSDPARNEIHRHLSDLFRCNNLVILAGLGTSLCVKDQETGHSLAPKMIDLWGSVKERWCSAKELDWEALMAIIRHPSEDTNLESLLSRCRLAESFLADDDLRTVKTFIQLAETCITESVDFLRPNIELTVHQEFLRRIARRSNRRNRAKVFTTNYDRCFEEAGGRGRYIVIDGFSQTQPPTFDSVHFTYDIVRRVRESETTDFIPNVFHLYKLHGSIDWVRDEATGEIHRVASTASPLLIYPRNSKYELAFSQPYLEMMSALQASLREPNTGLLVVGFGFNDSHLAEPILSAVRSNLALRVIVVSPGLAPWSENEEAERPGEAQRNPHLKKLANLTLGGDARLAMINCGFEELVPYIPDIVAESDLEKHLERVRKLELR